MATANGANGHKPPIIGTNLGDKLIASSGRGSQPTISVQPDARTVNPGQAVTYHAVPPTKITAGETLGVSKTGVDAAGRARMPDRPPGSMTRIATQERMEWARLQLRSRPRMPINGPDGLLVLLRKRFGIGLDPNVCIRIKQEVHAELSMLPPAVPAGITPAMAPPPVKVTAEVTAPNPSDDLEAAVQLVLGAVPGLRTFTINVDDQGVASVDYTTREVRVVESAGSLKVRK